MKREKVISEIKKCMEDEQYSEGERLPNRLLCRCRNPRRFII